jgi:hypothetical protein
MQIKSPGIREINSIEIEYDPMSFGFGSTRMECLDKMGFISLKSFLKLEDRCRKNLLPITTPLLSKINFDRKYVGISFRNRLHENERNISISQWIKIIEYVRNLCDYEIIAHGMDIDTIPSEKFGIKKAKDIDESIAYMNKSVLFIGSMSGISQFASNCAAPVLQIGDVSRHFNYDPFQKGCEAVEFKDHESAIRNFLI